MLPAPERSDPCARWRSAAIEAARAIEGLFLPAHVASCPAVRSDYQEPCDCGALDRIADAGDRARRAAAEVRRLMVSGPGANVTPGR